MHTVFLSSERAGGGGDDAAVLADLDVGGAVYNFDEGPSERHMGGGHRLDGSEPELAFRMGHGSGDEREEEVDVDDEDFPWEEAEEAGDIMQLLRGGGAPCGCTGTQHQP